MNQKITSPDRRTALSRLLSTINYPRMVTHYTTIFIIFFALSCSENTTMPQSEPKLIVEGTSCTDAWLTLQAEPGQTVVLTRDDTTEVFRGTLTSADTLLYDSGLLPSHSYRYKAGIIKDGEEQTQASVAAVTLDTTSHNFTLTMETIGSTSTSLNDVAIISENDIWAVGEIHTEETDRLDSLGNWVYPYNTVHWDGTTWELRRISTNACGGVEFPPIQTIFLLPDNQILFGHIDASITRYDGTDFINDCSFIQQINGSIIKIWGTSVDDFYVGGHNGLIAHYDGSGWEKLESSTDLPILDIWGVSDNKNENYFILCTATGAPLSDKKILQIHSDNSITEIVWPNQSRRLHSVWFEDASNIFLCGAGIFLRNRRGQYSEFTELPLITTNVIRGQGVNDLFAVGHFGILAHYNGMSWKEYVDFGEVNVFLGLAYEDDLAVAVGFVGAQGVIYMLQRL